MDDTFSPLVRATWYPHKRDAYAYDTFRRASNCALCISLARRDVANVKGVPLINLDHPHNVDAFDTFRRGASNCALCVGLGGMLPMLKGVLS